MPALVSAFFFRYSGAQWEKVDKCGESHTKPGVDMFSGVSTLNLDSKGRLAVPAKHRELLSGASAGRVMVTLNPAGCLLIYPKNEWQPVYEQLRKLSGPQAAVADVIIGYAEEMELDAAGRVLISPSLRARAKLDKEVALVGQGNKFALWDDARWNAKVDAVMAIDPAALAEQMQGIVL